MSIPAGERGSHARPPGTARTAPARRGAGRGRRAAPPTRQAKRSRIAALAVAAIGVLVIGLAAGFGSEPSAEPTAQAFLLDWQQQRYDAAGALTTASDRKSTRLNSSHRLTSRMPSSA